MTAMIAGAMNAARAEDLVVYFHERPPYSWRDASGEMHGLVAEPTEQALLAAKIAFKWEQLPSARQAEIIKGNGLAACGIGWFKRPERELFAAFSAPIYRDDRMVVIARRGDERFDGEPSLPSLFARRDIALLTKVGYSYGGYVDGQIKRLAPVFQETSTDNLHMLDMIALGRADYMLMSREEADYLLAGRSTTLGPLSAYRFMDAPAGEARYLMCSPRVPQSLLDRFNAALGKP